jgi:hypothetical protein
MLSSMVSVVKSVGTSELIIMPMKTKKKYIGNVTAEMLM